MGDWILSSLMTVVNLLSFLLPLVVGGTISTGRVLYNIVSGADLHSLLHFLYCNKRDFRIEHVE
jgi:hypothetical protein